LNQIGCTQAAQMAAGFIEIGLREIDAVATTNVRERAAGTF